MKTPTEDTTVGYKRPPKSGRWKPGQSGNPQHRRTSKGKSTVDLIDRLLLETVDITEKGIARKAPTLEAILMQLVAKEVLGNHQARRVRLKYQEFAHSNQSETKTAVTFVDNDYTQALSELNEADDNERL